MSESSIISSEEIEQLKSFYGTDFSADKIKRKFGETREIKVKMAASMVRHQIKVICEKKFQGHVILPEMHECYLSLDTWSHFVSGFSTSIEHKMHNNNIVLAHQAKQWRKLTDKADSLEETNKWRKRVNESFKKVQQHKECKNVQQLFLGMYTELYHYIV